MRRAARLRNPDATRVTIIEGDVLDARTPHTAMRGTDVINANLAGDMARQARAIVDAMHAERITRLIFISSMGIDDEMPGQRYSSVLDPYRDCAAIIEQSDLDFTILRPGWFTRDEAISYQLTRKGEPLKGHDVSLNSLSDLITRLATTPDLPNRCSRASARPDASDAKPLVTLFALTFARVGVAADADSPVISHVGGKAHPETPIAGMEPRIQAQFRGLPVGIRALRGTY